MRACEETRLYATDCSKKAPKSPSERQAMPGNARQCQAMPGNARECQGMPGGHVEANQVDKGSQADLAVGLDSADGRIENPPRSPRLDTFRRTYRVPRHPNDVIRPAITPDVPRVA